MNDLMTFISQPWPWYISGPLIALIMFLLLFAGKKFGMSSNFRTACTIGGAGRFSEFFRYDWRTERWNLLLAVGAAVGGYLASQYLSDNTVDIAESVEVTLNGYGIQSADSAYVPAEIFAKEALTDPKNLLILLAGGFLVGFGARYASGCTSGHAISGLSNLQKASLIAVTGFFAGGLTMVHLIFPLIFN